LLSMLGNHLIPKERNRCLGQIFKRLTRLKPILALELVKRGQSKFARNLKIVSESFSPTV